MPRDLQPTDYQRTRVIGFSVTFEIWSAFYAAIPNPSAWELLWYSGGSLDLYADANNPGWTANNNSLNPSSQGGLINGVGGDTDPRAGTSSVDRVILNVSGLAAQPADPTVPGYNGGVRPDLGVSGSTTGYPPGGYNGSTAIWKGYLDLAIANIRSKYPNARMILLQPNIGGPNLSQTTCTTADSSATGFGVVRCTYTSPFIRSAIAAVTRGNVRGGYGALVGDCTDFSDWAGHLHTTPQTTHGQAMATYYASHV
jgi:hypothetical protein